MTGAPAGDAVIRAARLIDGTGGPPIDRPTVVVRGGRIDAVYAGAIPPERLPPDTPVHDVRGDTLLPGLIDAHVHLVLPGDGTPLETTVQEPRGTLAALALRNARTALAAGITTLRDCGGMDRVTLDLKRALTLGYAVGPRLHVCRWPITITGGHCWYFGGEADGPEGMRRMVRGLAKAGVDFIKIMGSGGGTVGTLSSRPSYSVEELAAAVEEAHRLGRQVGIHCTCAAATRNALAAHADHVEHAHFSRGPSGSYEFEPAVVDALARTGTPVITTLCVSHYMVEALGARAVTTAAERAALDRWRRGLEHHLESARRMHDAGVRLVAGTDAGWRHTPFDGLVTEIELLCEAGMHVDEALTAATSGAAEALGIGGETGSLREGATADIIAVRGDPLANLDVLRRPTMIMRAGRFLHRDTIVL